ncbi:MAG TPA: DNA repair protein RadA [Elusimicrobia bacterium]|nr:MAG: DNA repair protein RadA [Elusimicrobia bacterium RIFOXYA12_FULL_49_49]OGS10270.1 MAG: DNA repair protein RadA [Elusimicrobia bacterium RIFOXYA1_FULL_47_7]OGS16611.1 MAG: DNA repair protein RadA [Elusimicrobia bacterium RIFOXYA2_FULL_47_53]OGS25816.1 MAG: DNA repair protein RadA [Elusimicrobia bacterium RIFOXYB12_FULL_50_12]OGS31589.1 MAG: DNA repair protein RadA [Elusimicrobia bacterium RIFOXYB2_FULL_46_23]HBU69036.1 DNA repair protein RadA [Elusimicrobiota bacterium]
MKPAKIKTIFRCQQCGYSSAKWLGRCPDCGQWNSFAEEKEAAKAGSGTARQLTGFSSEVVPLDKVSVEEFNRFNTGINEFDRMLGGGVVPGSLILLGGPPGIGKSTLMLQVSAAFSNKKGAERVVLYVSGEESLSQVKARADRLSIKSDKLFLVSETNLENILAHIETIKPNVVIIDSIQTTYRADLAGAPGSVGQVRECAAEFLRAAKSKNITMFLLGHVTKEGDIAGPRILEHIVDTVLYFEEERQQVYRVLRAYKNRFGPTSEIGVFEMGASGLMEVPNPSLLFLGERSMNSAGSVVVATIEGTRPLLLEVQSLVTRTNFGFPRRMVTGYDTNKVVLLIAVLEKRIGLNLEAQDIFVNVVGGVKIKETGVDLGIACAIASGFGNFVCPPKMIILGEVGLTGEVRSIAQISERLMEAEKLGFEKAIVPKSNLKGIKHKGKLEILGVESVAQAITIIKG